MLQGQQVAGVPRQDPGIGEKQHQEPLKDYWGQTWPLGLSPGVALQTTRNLTFLLSSKDQCPKEELHSSQPSQTCCQQIQIVSCKLE